MGWLIKEEKEELDMGELINLLVTHEGLRLKPYRDPVGKLTIGVGRNLDDVGITEEEALYLLKNDINRVLGFLSTRYDWWSALTVNRKMALVDMCFNLGETRFRTFKRMIKALEQGDYEKAADEMLDSKWARQVKGRAQTLARMMREG